MADHDHEHDWGFWIRVTPKRRVRQCLAPKCDAVQEPTTGTVVTPTLDNWQYGDYAGVLKLVLLSDRGNSWSTGMFRHGGDPARMAHVPLDLKGWDVVEMDENLAAATVVARWLTDVPPHEYMRSSEGGPYCGACGRHWANNVHAETTPAYARCKKRGPDLSMGNPDWECLTHDVLLERVGGEPGTDARRDHMVCPVAFDADRTHARPVDRDGYLRSFIDKPMAQIKWVDLGEHGWALMPVCAGCGSGPLSLGEDGCGDCS